jgi:protein required for attachment to host cells
MEKQTWLLVANASKARVYSLCKARLLQESSNGKDLTLKEACEHDESRRKGLELITDKLGHFGHGSFVEASNPKQHEAERFAIELNEKLDSARRENQYRELIIAAPPAFLGMLKKHMTEDLSKRIFKTIEKDYTAHDEKALVTALTEHL